MQTAIETAERGAEGPTLPNVATYMALTGVDPRRIGYWVECNLGAYKGMRFLYRTNNKTRVRRDKPLHDEPIELGAKRRRLGVMNQQMAVEYTPELDAERNALFSEILDDAAAYNDEHNRRMCHWLSSFVIDADPWPFSVAKPDPADPDSYYALYEEFEDLFHWLYSTGYDNALVESIKNY